MGLCKNINERMKEYETVTKTSLMRRQPVIVRLDGKAFHTFTKGLVKPYDEDFANAMEYVSFKLKDKVQNTVLIYSQSDEISLLLVDWKKLTTSAWFENNIQKIVSVSASLATTYFNEYIEVIMDKYYKLYKEAKAKNSEIAVSEYLDKCILWRNKKYKANFDSRAFNLPNNEVCNYFIARNKDAIRNSKQSLAQAYFSHTELQNKSSNDQVQMVLEKSGIDWNKLPSAQKYGFCIYKDDTLEDQKWIVDKDIPDFVLDRNYINRFIIDKDN